MDGSSVLKEQPVLLLMSNGKHLEACLELGSVPDPAVVERTIKFEQLVSRVRYHQKYLDTVKPGGDIWNKERKMCDQLCEQLDQMLDQMGLNLDQLPF
jgi:hypothetical protein